MLDQLQVAKGKEYQRCPTRFQILFKLEGINKYNLQHVAKLIISKSELVNYHEISYWKICDDNQICGIILLKKRWYKLTYPTITFQYNKQTIFCEVLSYTFRDQKTYDKRNEFEADYIFNTKDNKNKIYDDFFQNKQENQESKCETQENEELNKGIYKNLKIQHSQFKITDPSEESSLNLKKTNKELTKEMKENKKFENKIFKGQQFQFYLSIAREDQNVHLCTDDFNFKFLLTQKIYNKMWALFQKKNWACYQVLWNRSISSNFRLQINQCFLGQPLNHALFQRYLDMLKFKYVRNSNIHLISLILRDEQDIEDFYEELQHFKGSIKLNSGSYLFIYLSEEDNHSSLIIYNLEKDQVYIVDSKVRNGKKHIQYLKPKLHGFLHSLFEKYQERQMNYLIDPDDFWDSIKTLPCPSQRNQNDSHYLCLRNIHEFLLQDNFDINLIKAYQIEEILHYRFFVAACLMYDKYLSSY